MSFGGISDAIATARRAAARERQQAAAAAQRARQRERAARSTPPPPRSSSTPQRPQGVSPQTRATAARAQTPAARSRRAVQSTTQQVARATQRTGQTVRRGSPQVTGRQARDPAMEEFLRGAEVGERVRRGEITPEQRVGISGFNPAMFAQMADTRRPWLTGLVSNAGREAVGMALGVPAALQLAGRGLAYPALAGIDAIAPENSGLDRFARGGREGTEDAYRQAGTALRDDYAYRYGPLVRGDFGEFGSRVYESPLSFALDVSGAGAVAGRAPNIAARATARLTPTGSPLNTRARNYTSIMGPGEVDPLTLRPRETAGNRNRPARQVTGRAGSGPDAETRTVAIPQRPYSANAMTRGVQKAATRVTRQRIAPAANRAAERAEGLPGSTGAPIRRRATAALTRPFTDQARFNRYQRRETREVVLRRKQNEAATLADERRDYNRALRGLKRDTNEAGIATRAANVDGLGMEHLATRVHLEGLLTPKPGTTPRQQLATAVSRMREGINERRANGEDVRAEARQVERIAALPDDLLDLASDTPRARRVAAAVEAGRRLNTKAQDLEVDTGVVSAGAAAERSSLASRILLGGSRSASVEVAKRRRAGDDTGAATIRERAVSADPKVQALREAHAEAVAEYNRLSGRADRTAAAAKVAATRRAVDEYAQNINWKVAEAKQRRSRAYAAREKERRRYRNATREAAAQAKLKAENRRKAAAARADGPTTRQAFRAGEKAGAAKATARTAPGATPPKRTPDPQGHPTAKGAKPTRTRAGVSPAKASAFGREFDARAAGRRLNQAEAAARTARNGYVSARAAEARTKARPLTKAEDARLRAGLDKAERDLAAIVREVRDIAQDKPVALMRDHIRAREELAALRKARVGTPAKISAAAANRRALRAQLYKAETDALDAALTPPVRPQLVGHDGVYIPHMRRRMRTASDPFRTGRGFGGPKRPKRSKGILIGDGVIDWNPALLAHQAQRASSNAVGPMSRQALAELVDLAAFTGRNGDPIKGPRAIRLAQTDPDNVALINIDTLQKALRDLDELDPGDWLSDQAVNEAVAAGRNLVMRVAEDGPNSGQYIAISKAAADEWRGAMQTPSDFAKVFDAIQDRWKGAILALSPRWYVNSTFGIALQYGLLTGMDIRSIVQANRKKGGVRAAIPTREALNTLAEDVGFKGSFDSGRIERAMTKGFEINNKIEAAWRRAAYLNRAKSGLRGEGVRTRRMSDEEIVRAIETMPESLARQITRDVDLYLGEFRKFSPFGQSVLRRAIPFYSWLRVITKLTLHLPFRSPLRAAALMVSAKAGVAGISPEDYQRPYYDRGALVFGDLRVRSAGWNSFATLVPFANALGEMSQTGSLTPMAREFGSWLSPSVSWMFQQFAGANTFGNTAFTPDGPFGVERINPVTGDVQPTKRGVPILDVVLNATIPGQVGPFRRALAAGDSVYDSTSTLELLKFRLGVSTKKAEDLFYERKGKPVNSPVGPKGSASAVGGFFGLPVMRENARERERRYEKGQRDARRAARREERGG